MLPRERIYTMPLTDKENDNRGEDVMLHLRPDELLCPFGTQGLPELVVLYIVFETSIGQFRLNVLTFHVHIIAQFV